MIIRRKMPRLIGRRPIGIIGLRTLRQSSDHVRRMVVSQLPASISNIASTESQPERPPAYAPFDTPFVSTVSEPQSRMPKDLQAIYNMHKALGRVQTPTKSLRERIAERKAHEPQFSPPSARIQKRPDNVRYEPDPRVQRSPTPSIESDIEPLPEMPPPKSNRVRSFVEYVNVSSGVPESRQSDNTNSDDSDDSEADAISSSPKDVSDWLSEDDLPDAIPGSYIVDNVSSSASSLNNAGMSPKTPIQRDLDDDHPTLEDMDLEALQSEPDSHSETVQRHFAPLEISDEDLLFPPRYNAPRVDGQQNEFSDRDDDLSGERVVDSSRDTTGSQPVQSPFTPPEINNNELTPRKRHDVVSRADGQYETFSDDNDGYTEMVMDSGNDSLPVQRSFAPPETSNEDLSPPPRYDASRLEERHGTFSDDDYDVYTETVMDGGSDPVSSQPIQRSVAPLEVNDEELSPPLRHDYWRDQGSFLDDGDDGYTETVIDSGSEEVADHSSTQPIQRSFAPIEVDAEDLLPPLHPEIHQPEVVHSDRVSEPKRNDPSETRKSPPVQRNFDPIEANTEDLLSPVSYSGDTQDRASSSPIQRSIDDEWEETSFLMDIDEPSFEKPTTPQREFESVETSTEDLFPPSYQQPDRSNRRTVNTEKPIMTDRSQPHRMTVSHPESPIVQRFSQPDSEQTSRDVGMLNRRDDRYDVDEYDDIDTSELPYQALDLGQALLDAGMAKPKQVTQPQQQHSFSVLMPPIGRAHHSTSSASTQRVSVEQSIQRTEVPAPSQISQSSVDASLLDALGMPSDTVIQRSGPEMPSISEIPPHETSVAIQRIDEGTSESGDSGESLGNESRSSPNVEEMAKQVYRILQRRFRIERERSKGR